MFDTIATGNDLRSIDARELHERGFVVLPGPMSVGSMERVSSAYDSIVASANAEDVHTGRTGEHCSCRSRSDHQSAHSPSTAPSAS